MYAVERLSSYISRGVYTVSAPFHPFGGAVDIIVVEQKDGSFKSSPWYVRFGKFQGVLKTKEKIVNITVNGVDSILHMYLDHKGEAYFLQEVDPRHDQDSSSGEEETDPALIKSQNCHFHSDAPKIVPLSNSKRSRILGLMFGRRRSMTEDIVTEETGMVRRSSLDRAELAADLLEVKWSTNLTKNNIDRDLRSSICSVQESLEICDSAENQISKEGRSLSYCQTELGGSCDKTNEGSEGVHLHISEVHSRQEPNPVAETEYLNTLVIHDREETSASKIRNSTATESVSSVDVHLMASDSGENEVVQVIHEDTTITINEIVTENFEIAESSIYLAPEEEIHTDNITDPQEFGVDCVLTEANSISSSEGSEEQHFVLTDQDDFKPVDKGVVDKLDSTAYESHSLENQSDDSEEHIENPVMKSNPINIPTIPKAFGVLGQVARSLPNTWPHANSLVSVNLCHPLGHSLDSNTKSLDWTSNYIKSDVGNGQTDIDDIRILVELRNFIASGGVEISLCKHLLYEGMGSETASQAFESEKVDAEKFSFLGATDITKNDRLVVKISNHYFPWDVAAPIILGMVSFGSKVRINPKGMIVVDSIEKISVGKLSSDLSKSMDARSGSWRIWPFFFRRSTSNGSFQETMKDSRSPIFENSAEKSNLALDGDKYVTNPTYSRKTVRIITPTSEQLALLNLKEGRNIVTFTFSTAVLGKQQVDARIYLWKWNTRIVISDVDGTITKSDVLGQFMPMVGVDWSHTGVAHLFSAIKENGYQLLFLSARAISQAYLTRQFLINLKQDGKVLPDGPVVISPDGLFPSLFREVIRRAPHEFKIACLEDIKVLFPPDCNPFYAGFGNRDTDEFSYLKVGIPKGKIYIINPKGEVVVNRCVDTKSYASLHSLVHGMFPPVSTSEQEDFNSWNFWKLPPPTID